MKVLPNIDGLGEGLSGSNSCAKMLLLGLILSAEARHGSGKPRECVLASHPSRPTRVRTRNQGLKELSDP